MVNCAGVTKTPLSNQLDKPSMEIDYFYMK